MKPGRLELRMLGLLIAVWVVFALIVEGFISVASFTSILGRSVETGLIAVGFTVALLSGKIDLSVGALYALAGVTFATLDGMVGTGPALLGALAVGLLVGVTNGTLIGRYGVNSFTATLVMLLVARGLAFTVSGGRPVSALNLDASLWVNQTVLGPISPRIIAFVLVVAVIHMLVTRSRAGRELVAIGGNTDAATAAGILVERRVMLACIVSSLAAALAGGISALSLLSGSPIVGDANLLGAVAAVFLGGAALTGGVGSVIATALAMLVLSSIATGMELAFLPKAWQIVVTGVIIIVASTGILRTRAGAIVSELKASVARLGKMRTEV